MARLIRTIVRVFLFLKKNFLTLKSMGDGSQETGLLPDYSLG